MDFEPLEDGQKARLSLSRVERETLGSIAFQVLVEAATIGGTQLPAGSSLPRLATIHLDTTRALTCSAATIGAMGNLLSAYNQAHPDSPLNPPARALATEMKAAQCALEEGGDFGEIRNMAQLFDSLEVAIES